MRTTSEVGIAIAQGRPASTRHPMPPIPLSGDIRAVRTIWQPAFTCVVRIREAATELWSCVFATPVPACIFTDLKPDTEYELQVRARTATGEGKPALLGMRTNPAGTSDNIIPFPKR